MARPLRVEYAGACCHVINRGNYRRDLFNDRGSGAAFERTLGEAARRFGWRIHAYVIMRNHFHLALELSEPNLSLGMKWLQGTWIRRYNGYRKLIGRPFQGRFKSLLVEPGPAFGKVCHYIHLNPVRAGVVTMRGLPKFALGSLAKFLNPRRPEWLVASTALGQAGGLKDTAAGWRSYLQYLEFLATDEVAKKELVAKRMSRGWCVGSADFRKEQREIAAERGARFSATKFEGIEPADIAAERTVIWEVRLQTIATAAKVDIEKLGPRKSDAGKVLVAAAMKHSTSASNGWLATRLAMGEPASVSQFVRRLLLTEDGQAAVAKVLARVRG